MESKPSNNGLFKEPWSDLLFVKKIDMEITESVRFWVKHALGPTTKPLESRMTGQWSDRSPETGNYLICGNIPALHSPTQPFHRNACHPIQLAFEAYLFVL